MSTSSSSSYGTLEDKYRKYGPYIHHNCSLLRWEKELVEFEKDQVEEIFGFSIVNESSLHKWEAKIKGPVGTPYENGVFVLSISIPPDYPFSPPEIKFKTKILHPNINSKGEICLDVLKDKWNSVLTLTTVLLSIYLLLLDPNTDDFLVPELAFLYNESRTEYDAKVKDWTRKHAIPNNTPTESSSDDDNAIPITNASLTISYKIKVQEPFDNQLNRSCRSERFSVYEPLLGKTLDNGESKEPLPIIKQCLLPQDNHQPIDKHSKPNFHYATHKLKFKHEIQLLCTTLPVEAFKLRNKERYKWLRDKFVPMMILSEKYKDLDDQQYQMLARNLLITEPRTETELIESEENTIFADALLARVSQRAALKLYREQKYENLIEELSWTGVKIKSKFWKKDTYTNWLRHLSATKFRLRPDDFLDKHRYTHLIDELGNIVLESVEFKFTEERKNEFLIHAVLPEILNIETWEFLEQNELMRLADELLQKGLENEEFGLQEDSCTKLFSELFQLIDTTPENIGHECAHLYTMPIFPFSQLNECLREAHETKIKTYGPFVRLLYLYFNHQSSNEVYNIKVYRGMNLSLLMIDAYKEAMESGRSCRWAGFSSTSKSQNVADIFGNNTLFIMHLKKLYHEEKKAIDISGYSHIEDEEEVLLKAGVEFTVKAVDYIAEENKYYIHLEVYV